MSIEIDGRRYSLVRGSDLDRDGMYLEVSEDDAGGEPIAEVFYSDVNGAFSLSLYRDMVPLAVIEHAIATARESLPPIADAQGSS